MPVEIVHEPVMLAVGPGGAVYLEVNPDFYGPRRGPRAEVAALAEREKRQTALDPAAVEQTIARREGLARRVDAPTRSGE